MNADETIRAEARAAVLRVSMLHSADLDALSVAVGSQADSLRTDGVLLGLPTSDGFLYPAFQFDDGLHVRVVVATVNVALDALGDPWGVGSWWVSPSARLGVAPWVLVGGSSEADLLTLAGSG